MEPDGTLSWKVPPGDWVILRMGYSLTGEKNQPATPEATGLEVDKLSRKDVDAYVRTYAELPTTGDGLLNKGQVDVPMGEFWTHLPGQSDTPSHDADVREAASAAHIYGKPIVATESFTSMPFIPGWGQSPFYLKPQATGTWHSA
jgi:alpha-L-rhamnosidase